MIPTKRTRSLTRRWCLLMIGLGVLFSAHPAAGQSPIYSTGATIPDVSITSATAGTQIVSGYRRGCTVELATVTTVPVWVVRIAGDCTTNVTGDAGIRLSNGDDKYSSGHQFLSSDGWNGQLCGVLESGVTPADLKVNCW